MKFLLDHGVDANATCRGVPLLQLAALHYNCAKAVRLLLEHGAEVARLEQGGRTTLIQAIQNRLDKPIVNDLIRFGVPKDLTVELYLEGAKKVAAKIQQNPSLVRELDDPIELMNHAIGSKELVELLLNLGVDPNAHGPTKPAPLRLAVRQLRFPVVQLLIDHGANPNPKDAAADTPVIAVPIEHSKAALLKKIVDYLLAHGAKGDADAAAHEQWMSVLDRLARRAKRK